MKPQTILIVDDDPDVLVLFSKLVEHAGYRVKLAVSSESALELIREHDIDLVLLDLNMPPPDGFSLLQELRRGRSGLPVVVVSGYLQGSLLKAAEFVGATATISKMDATELLLPTIRRILESPPPPRPKRHRAGGEDDRS